jgi:hypothetical protein
MKILSFLLVLLASQNSVSQIQDCQCNGFLIPDQKQIPLYNNNNTQTILYTIKNDPFNEVYYNFSITKHKKGYLRVIPFSINDSLKKSGWIKNKNVGIYSAAYNRILYLYADSNSQSNVLYSIKEYFPEPLTILSCSGKWLYVEITLKNKCYRGWMAPEDQCSNVYTTCN